MNLLLPTILQVVEGGTTPPAPDAPEHHSMARRVDWWTLYRTRRRGAAPPHGPAAGGALSAWAAVASRCPDAGDGDESARRAAKVMRALRCGGVDGCHVGGAYFVFHWPVCC